MISSKVVLILPDTVEESDGGVGDEVGDAADAKNVRQVPERGRRVGEAGQVST